MNRIFTSVLILLGFVIINDAKAQQEHQVSHNMFNNLYVNPGFAGSSDAICGTLIGRNQWMGFPGAPKTAVFSLDAPVRLIGNCGVGLSVLSDKLGYEKNTGVKVDFAKKLAVGNGVLGLGLSGAILSKSYDYSGFKPIESGDALLNSTSVEQAMIFDLGFGAFYKIPDKLYVGLSGTQLLGSKGDYGVAALKSTPQLARHAFFTAGYYHDLTSTIQLQPSIFLKSDFSSTQLDVNLLALYNQRFWGGLSYRTQDAVSVLVGLHPLTSNLGKSLRIGIAYDLTTSQIGRNGGASTVELMIGYCFKIEHKPSVSSYRTVRFG